jgi:hypothetical protein
MLAPLYSTFVARFFSFEIAYQLLHEILFVQLGSTNIHNFKLVRSS